MSDPARRGADRVHPLRLQQLFMQLDNLFFRSLALRELFNRAGDTTGSKYIAHQFGIVGVILLIKYVEIVNHLYPGNISEKKNSRF
ncbi:hypothetical protein [Geopsychrobacter electrodiphilus]|uniref:hypothetical protein n=1 Tax=Geopsychrobacter electrodiphilus TaxID=225196 RepID=UPI0012EC6C0D|nr:hypothetical protein [Geopsychrobacter electrodiphilus]